MKVNENYYECKLVSMGEQADATIKKLRNKNLMLTTLLDEKNNIVGYMRSAAYSPNFKKIIGIAMINKPYWDNKTHFKIDINDKIFVGTVCDLPFI